MPQIYYMFMEKNSATAFEKRKLECFCRIRSPRSKLWKNVWSGTHHSDDGLDSFRRGFLARRRFDESAAQIFEGEPCLRRILGFLPMRRARRAAALYALTAVRQRPFLA